MRLAKSDAAARSAVRAALSVAGTSGAGSDGWASGMGASRDKIASVTAERISARVIAGAGGRARSTTTGAGATPGAGPERERHRGRDGTEAEQSIHHWTFGRVLGEKRLTAAIELMRAARAAPR